MLKQILIFFYAIPKSIRLADQCKGNKCFNWYEFHIWRMYQLQIKDKQF